MLAVNLCQSDVSEKLGLKKFESLNLNSLYFDNVMNIEIGGIKQQEINFGCPLKHWNQYVFGMTGVQVE